MRSGLKVVGQERTVVLQRPLAGKTTLAIYEISAGAVTQHAVIGVDPVGTTQANWKDAESEFLVLQLAKW